MTDNLQFGFADRSKEIDRLVMEILAGERRPELTPEAEALLRILRFCKGAAMARRTRDLAAATGLSVRDVKQAARSLVMDYGLWVAGSRMEPFGYYLAVTGDELGDARRPLVGEIRELGLRVIALGGERELRAVIVELEAEISRRQGQRETEANHPLR